ncbi:MAG: molecular chaperone DnaJ [Acidimicrobiales bacterium]|jgi:molecular chaperone DnaJ|nr:molecular chaperone DnaJ [Actinomycetes bacterium]MDP6159958.1 molecular chaperone DnaJ [Acidimicrobiales bacterium]MDP6286782.1 molecular chaperone DnaJ [Acidimicrobiales bacterium]MDP6911424.1 molecular chaperone DnaJ [Acidimicrobiales bacterium]HJM73445.1 molecular chaperone DnaJ [Acidimicrobiales bacterium]
MTAQREWFEKDFYASLGVSKEASAKEITKAYRKLARQLHPDANPGDATSEARFKEVSAAYDVVGDESRRAEYDQIRQMGPMGGFGPGPGGGMGGGFPGTGGMGGFDLGDLFGGAFNGGRGSGRGQRGADLETRLTLSFTEAVNGVTTSVHLVSDTVCSTCSGSGARPGTRPTACGACRGRGVQAEDQGPFSFSRPCGQCGGRGSQIDDPCGSCQASGVERRPREVKVRIPAGVDEGQRIRLKRRGEPGRGGPDGDLFIVVAVEPDIRFGRRGRHLTVSVPVTYPQAVLGSEIEVPLLDGGTVTLKVPAGTRSGQTFRVKKRGVPEKGGTGDLLVSVEVDVLTDPTEAEIEAVEVLAEAMAARRNPKEPQEQEPQKHEDPSPDRLNGETP